MHRMSPVAQSMSVRPYAVALMLFAVCAWAEAVETARPPYQDTKMSFGFNVLEPDGGEFYPWPVRLRLDETSPTGAYLPTTCEEAKEAVDMAIPGQLRRIVRTSWERTRMEIGRARGLGRDDFLVFHGNVSEALRNEFAPYSGFLWDLKQKLLRDWQLEGNDQRPEWRTVLCDPDRVSADDSAGTRFDALLVQVVVAEDGRSGK